MGSQVLSQNVEKNVMSKPRQYVKQTLGNQSGFSLLELMVVVSIISILASMGYQSYHEMYIKAQWTSFFATAQSYRKSVIAEFSANGGSPIDWPVRTMFTADTRHSYGGALFHVYVDNNGDGRPDQIGVVFDDDAPGTSFTDNTGIIPSNLIDDFEIRYDDGVQNTGRLHGNITPGEMIIYLDL
jgi:prepilin-type N-terminal cleavage/methylation domain-containing protein